MRSAWLPKQNLPCNLTVCKPGPSALPFDLYRLLFNRPFKDRIVTKNLSDAASRNQDPDLNGASQIP